MRRPLAVPVTYYHFVLRQKAALFQYVMQAGVMAPETAVATSSMANSASAIAAFFGGYSVRFATGLLERLLPAVFPETTARP